MTEETFLRTHQVLMRNNLGKNQIVIISLLTGDSRKYNFDFTSEEASQFELFTGLSLEDELFTSVADLIKNDYKIEQND